MKTIMATLWPRRPAIPAPSRTNSLNRLCSSIVVPACLTITLGILWLPSLIRSGYVFERDPSFFASTRADISWSLGAFSFLGGTSNISNQGLFYEPYAILTLLLHAVGIGPAGTSKIIPVMVSAVALIGSFVLLRDVALTTTASIIGAIFFLLNPWSLDQFGYFFIWTGYCMLPLLVLGTKRIIYGKPTPWWFPIVLIFLGGIEAWVIAFLVLTLAVVTIRPPETGPLGIRIFRPYLWFVGSACYWLPAYSSWALLQGTSALRYSSTGIPLQSALPLSNLLELRDFWWPHLSPIAAVGHGAAALATIASICIVGTAILRITNDLGAKYSSSGNTDTSGVLNIVSFVSALGFAGIALGEGTSGLFGPLYSWFHTIDFPGHTIIASLTRTPANLAAPFIFAVAIGLATATVPRQRYRYMNHAEGAYKIQARSLFRVGCISAATLACCLPSVLAFWETYQPISIPQSYHVMDRLLPDNMVLELGYWNDQSLEKSGFGMLWRFTWSKRMVADPTLLASSVNNPSLAPTSNAVNAFDLRVFDQPSPMADAHLLVTTLKKLKIHTVIVENDVRRSASSEAKIESLIRELAGLGGKIRTVKQQYIVTFPGRSVPLIWSSGCRIDQSWMWLGAVHLDCVSHHRTDSTPAVIDSAFNLPRPLGIGVRIRTIDPLYQGMGDVVKLAPGHQGWLIAPVQVATVFGGVMTVCWVIALPTVAIFRRRRYPFRNSASADIGSEL